MESNSRNGREQITSQTSYDSRSIERQTPQREEMSSLKRNATSPPPCTRTYTRRKQQQPTVPDGTLKATPQIPSPTMHHPPMFSHSSAADVMLRLYLDPPSPSPSSQDLELSLHSDVLRRSNYFSALLSDRWQKDCSGQVFRLNLGVSSSQFGSFDDHVKVLHLLYTNDFTGSINSVSTALSILHIALELLFEECVKACVRFIEAVAWTREEEKQVLDVIPLLREEESRELRARICVEKKECSEEMMYSMIHAAIDARDSKKWKSGERRRLVVENLMRDFSSKRFVKLALSKAFKSSLRNLHTLFKPYLQLFSDRASVSRKVSRILKQLMWLVERVIELRVANNAASKWSNEALLAADLHKALKVEAWNLAATEIPISVLQCLCKLTNGVATGSILIDRQARMNLVKNWLPFLIVCKDKVVLKKESDKSLYPDLEQAFLKIISTLPISDTKDFLQQCLSFSTDKMEDCPHLVSTLKTWFLRATHPPEGLVPPCTTTPV